MSARSSRTYKLKLSPRGIALFIECHARLCRVAGDLLPYGLTLRLAVTLFGAMRAEEQADKIWCSDLALLAGNEIRFVGTSRDLAVLSADLIERLGAAGVRAAPQTWRLYLAALLSMRSADDGSILNAYVLLRDGDQ